MEKQYTIKKEARDFFRAYVEILKPFLKNIRDREADIFAEILYQNYQKREVGKIDRFKLILSSEGRRTIEEKLNINSPVMRNALSSLKKKNLIREDNTIHDAYLVYPEKDKKNSITFSFIVENL